MDSSSVTWIIVAVVVVFVIAVLVGVVMNRRRQEKRRTQAEEIRREAERSTRPAVGTAHAEARGGRGRGPRRPGSRRSAPSVRPPRPGSGPQQEQAHARGPAARGRPGRPRRRPPVRRYDPAATDGHDHRDDGPTETTADGHDHDRTTGTTASRGARSDGSGGTPQHGDEHRVGAVPVRPQLHRARRAGPSWSGTSGSSAPASSSVQHRVDASPAPSLTTPPVSARTGEQVA